MQPSYHAARAALGPSARFCAQAPRGCLSSVGKTPGRYRVRELWQVKSIGFCQQYGTWPLATAFSYCASIPAQPPKARPHTTISHAIDIRLVVTLAVSHSGGIPPFSQ